MRAVPKDRSKRSAAQLLAGAAALDDAAEYIARAASIWRTVDEDGNDVTSTKGTERDRGRVAAYDQAHEALLDDAKFLRTLADMAAVHERIARVQRGRRR